jgi:hypothetical protein
MIFNWNNDSTLFASSCQARTGEFLATGSELHKPTFNGPFSCLNGDTVPSEESVAG